MSTGRRNEPEPVSELADVLRVRVCGMCMCGLARDPLAVEGADCNCVGVCCVCCVCCAVCLISDPGKPALPRKRTPTPILRSSACNFKIIACCSLFCLFKYCASLSVFSRAAAVPLSLSFSRVFGLAVTLRFVELGLFPSEGIACSKSCR